MAHRCRECFIPEDYPRVKLNRGVCNLCSAITKKQIENSRLIREKSRLEFQDILKKRRKAKYDCVVAFSGGKDSSYLLWYLVKEYGLNPLAVTVDTGHLGSVVLDNVYLVTKKLKVDYEIIDAVFLFKIIYKKAFKEGFFSERQGLPCAICSQLVPNIVVNFALKKDIPLVMNGKFDPENPRLFDVDTQDDITNIKKGFFGIISNARFSSLVYASREKKSVLPQIISPLNTIDYRENDAIRVLSKALDIKDPKQFYSLNTLCFISLVTIFLFKKKLGFNPYYEDVSRLIRWGVCDRSKVKRELEETERRIAEDPLVRNSICRFLESLL
ncbi:MAG: hypothetical protein NC923_05100 [Candidatus Omnitrophica bacterium]|nr:hypothetical protein [Candidatus Omnitrophota bacterium]